MNSNDNLDVNETAFESNDEEIVLNQIESTTKNDVDDTRLNDVPDRATWMFRKFPELRKLGIESSSDDDEDEADQENETNILKENLANVSS